MANTVAEKKEFRSQLITSSRSIERFKDYILQEIPESYGKIYEAKRKLEDKIVENVILTGKILIAKEKLDAYNKIIYHTLVPRIANVKLEGWKQENYIRQGLKDDPINLKQRLIENHHETHLNITRLISNPTMEEMLDDYVIQFNILVPKKPKTKDDVKKTILTHGENEFNGVKMESQLKAQAIYYKRLKLARKAREALDAKFSLDGIKQKIAKTVMKIEETIADIRKKLDSILGLDFSGKSVNPESFDFDINSLLGKMTALLDPITGALSPFAAAGIGNVPILGDLAGIFSILGQPTDTGGLTKEQIKKLIGDFKPQISEKVKGDMDGIVTDIGIMFQTLNMFLFKIIFYFFKQVCSLFKIVQSLIPLGPLGNLISLVTQAPSLVDTIMDAAQKVPKQMLEAVKGKIKDQLAAAMALAVPQPNIDLGLLESCIPLVKDSEANTPSQASQPKEKKLDYQEVNKQYLSNQLKDSELTLQDMNVVAANYKQIYNGTNQVINKYTDILQTKVDVTQKIPGTDQEIFMGYDNKLVPVKQQIIRTKSTPEDYSKYLSDDVIPHSYIDRSVNFGYGKEEELGWWTHTTSREHLIGILNFDKLKNVKKTIGPFIYKNLSADIQKVEPGSEIVVPNQIKVYETITKTTLEDD